MTEGSPPGLGLCDSRGVSELGRTTLALDSEAARNGLTARLHQFFTPVSRVFFFCFFAFFSLHSCIKTRTLRISVRELRVENHLRIYRDSPIFLYIYLYSNKKKKGGMTRTKRPEWGNREVLEEGGGRDVGVELASDNNFGN